MIARNYVLEWKYWSQTYPYWFGTYSYWLHAPAVADAVYAPNRELIVEYESREVIVPVEDRTDDVG